MGTSEGQSRSVVERINQKLLSGELYETPIATFHFRYLTDPRYTGADPGVKTTLEQLDIPRLTVTETEKTVKDLKIKKGFTATTLIPTTEETEHIIPSLGIGGRAVSPTEVRYYFDPTHLRVVESLRLWKDRQIAHEMNHVARMQANKRGNTLLDAFLSEGLATYYEEHWGGTYQQTPWGHVLPQEKLNKIWRLAQLALFSRTYNYREWFFGQNGTYPVWTGYTLGTAIVDQYMVKHPRMSMSRLVQMQSTEILKQSGFA